MKAELYGRKFLLGISGSIAAYKTAVLVRLLIKAGAEVQVLMTDSATQFIPPLTLSTLSRRTVFTTVTNGEGWNNHVELGLWADAMIIAPVTATTLGKLANGIADNMVVATYLSARCPVFFAPAMDLDMWQHPATRRNVVRLQDYGNHLIPVGYGELASGLVGDGRMAEPETIVRTLTNHFQTQTNWEGRTALVTAGPTHEALDPVRYLGNRSSGKMGVAIAEAMAARGAVVHLVLGPSAEQVQHARINVHRVISAREMFDCCEEYFEQCDVSVMAAAVADYRPATIADSKLKKSEDELSIRLERTEDIAATLGARKRNDQLLIGFALETDRETENAQSKLHRKNFDFIVLNSLRDAGAGFRYDTNKVTFVHRDGSMVRHELKSKREVADDIVDAVEKLFQTS